MPRYAYECPQGHASEAFKPLADIDAPQECPTCGAAARRILAPVQIITESARPDRDRKEAERLKRHNAHLFETRRKGFDSGALQFTNHLDRSTPNNTVDIEAAVDKQIDQFAAAISS